MTLPLDGLPAEPPPGPQVLRVFVPGRPAPQGSKRAIVHKQSGKAITMESSKAVKPWRADVRQALVDDAGQPVVRIAGAIVVTLEFVLPRPKYLARKATPPHTKAPDVDKLVRSTFDAITSAGVWADDACAVRIDASKRYAENDEATGCHIHLQAATSGPIHVAEEVRA
ncbi:Phage Holliday junction resolvase [Alloactinosynnema sp. L-07]|uniref:RusA family crossover junction endodeoxyribonuclease n=1 Tax=Alloactinosynnema sp. L-07 TaxID=1653480 RepID=UPI00065F06F1|nr:RusA family crossover junction endodeoxyribonuclease [Alloactinosynnema sp. L-07]CRK59052.1 Phage Holliday junction resolvase [Alloactinosynnema sp. L-07]